MRSLLPSRRVAIPLIGAVLCLLVAGWVPPLVGYALVIAGFGLVLDGCLAMLPTTGSLKSHRQ